MHQYQPVSRAGFHFAQWLVLFFMSAAGVGVAFAVFLLVIVGLGLAWHGIPVLPASLVLAACFGPAVGLAQGFVLRQHGQGTSIWLLVTVLGLLVASPVILIQSGMFGLHITLQASLVLSLATGGALGVAQWLVLRKRTRLSAWWIGISLAGWVIGGLMSMTLKTSSWGIGSILYWFGLFFSGTVISAAGLVWFVNRQTPVFDR